MPAVKKEDTITAIVETHVRLLMDNKLTTNLNNGNDTNQNTAQKAL
jgi:phosphoenolpyruvate-protein kinase (PTS system EI component)